MTHHELRKLAGRQTGSPAISRREALRLLAAAGLAPAAGSLAQAPAEPLLTLQQDALLDDLQHSAIRFFFEQASQKNGQVRDRASATAQGIYRAASTAATGFGLTALCIADQRGYISASDVRQRVLATLEFHWERLPHDHGFFYHFADIDTGARIWGCEISSIDTAILLCGVLTCRAHFTGEGIETQIRELATRLYERVDWPWMLDGATTFSMGFKPETGFLKAHWSVYCELMMLYLLAIGSPTHPVAPTYWQNFARPYINYSSFRYISDLAPLFTHQYSHAWFDFRGQRDRYANYFQNSVAATRAHRAFCLAEGMGYKEDFWGVTASDSAQGYTAWGGPPMLGEVDGTVVPCATAGSLPFLPQECLRVLMNLRENFEREAWGRYGFVDAFHPEFEWFDQDIIAIDQGISLLMAENLRTEFVWKTFMRNPEPRLAMQLCGFRPSRV